MFFGIVDQLVPLIQVDHLPRRLHIHPAPLAPQLATVNDGDKQKRREMDAVLQAFLELLHRAHPLIPKIKRQLPQQPLIGLLQHAFGELINHSKLFFTAETRRRRENKMFF